MATKTFKIGESSRGGVITAEVKGNKVTVIFKSWNWYDRNASKAVEYNRIEVDATSNFAQRNLFFELTDDTTAYWADTVIEWIKTKVKFNHAW